MISIMTLRAFYEAVASNEITPEVIAKANELITKHDAELVRAAEKRAEKAKTSDTNAARVFEMIDSTPLTSSDILAQCEAEGMTRADGKPLTTQYIARLVKNLVDAGKVARTDVKVVGSKGKKVGYTLVPLKEEL